MRKSPSSISKRLAFDDTSRAFASDDEANAGLRVTMGDGMLSGLKHLDIELEGVRRGSFVGTAQPDDSPRNHFQADDLARLSDGVLDIFPLPQARFIGGSRLAMRFSLGGFPVARQIFLL